MRAVALVAVLLASPVVAFDRVDRLVLLRIEGHVGPRRAEDRAISELTLRRGESLIRLTVDEIWVLSGDLVGLDILHEVEPYEPNMSVDGPPPLLDRLAAAGPDEPLELTGYFRRGQRILMLSAVERRDRRRGGAPGGLHSSRVSLVLDGGLQARETFSVPADRAARVRPAAG
jgi:hypothetical protein